jgi:hypothetical protein
MKALRVAVCTLVAGVFLVGVVAAISFASFRAGYNTRCKTGSWLALRTPERIKLFDGMAWTRHALACRVGEYQVMVPSEPGQGDNAYIFRKDRPFVLMSDDATNVFDDSGERIIFSHIRANAKRPSSSSYLGYDSVNNAFIDNFDINADGILDFRTTTVGETITKREARVGDRWLEVVQHHGRAGVMFNGRFMPVPDAIKLAASRK